MLDVEGSKVAALHVHFLPTYPIIIALIILASAPFLILNNEDGIANTIAGYALYLLLVGVLGKIILFLIRHEPDEKVDSSLIDTR